MERDSSRKCVACPGIFLKSELAEDGRCPKCVKQKREPQRNQNLERIPISGWQAEAHLRGVSRLTFFEAVEGKG